MTKNSESDYFFFPPPKSEYFFRKKNHNSPLQVNWSFPKQSITCILPVKITLVGCINKTDSQEISEILLKVALYI
jgi:hypothetical protein